MKLLFFFKDIFLFFSLLGNDGRFVRALSRQMIPLCINKTKCVYTFFLRSLSSVKYKHDANLFLRGRER